jgi:RHS repeat-associated protein
MKWKSSLSGFRSYQTASNYNYHRDYDPQVGRYAESDPIGLGGGSYSTYSYGRGNPVSNFHPLGLECVTVGTQVACSTPGGPSFVLPAPPGFPASLDEGILYHYYKVSRSLGCADPNAVMQGLINSPTPGNANPATADGTANNAVVPFFPLPNIVTSYLTTDVNTGAPLVVNLTGPGSAYGPGYVARYVGGGNAVTVGEGLNPIQAPLLTSPFLQYLADEALWGGQMSNIIKKAKSSCGCGQ